MTTKTRSATTRKRRSRRGSVMLLTALSMPVIAGFAGLGLDVGIWETNKRSLQTAADSAAISGALEKSGGGNHDAIQAVAVREAGRNGFVSAAGMTYVVNNPPTTGSLAGNATAVEVFLHRPEKPLLASLVWGNQLSLAVRSVATIQPGANAGKACVLALHPTVSGSVEITGSTTVNMSNCVVAANSVSS